MRKSLIALVGIISLGLFSSAPVFADRVCPEGSPYTDGANNTVTFDDKFGPGTEDKLRCNKYRNNVKMVIQVNAAFDSRARMYGFRNLPNIINDLNITHGVKQWEIAVVIHSGGFPFVLDPRVQNAHPMSAANDTPVNAPYPGLKGYEVVETLIDKGVDVYFCLNTAAAVGIANSQIIPGVQYVPAGLSSIADFQRDGFTYIQP